MPVIKPIAGHTSVRGVQRYLEKDDRALAVDLLNLSWDEDRDRGSDPELKKEVDWATEMDLTRMACGNDTPWRGKRARTYMHFVVSPDPRDRISLAQMRELAQAWCRENWGDYECAIVYHDDNEGGVMHAHVVVNNTNLVTGRRFQNPNPRVMQASIQRLAAERGLGFFVDESREEEAAGELAARARPRTRQQVYVRRAEREIEGKGGYSWVADIRSRVTIAKRLAQSPEEYIDLLETMGVQVTDASPKGGRNDWLYALQGHETWRIRGENLGLAYGRRAVEGVLRGNDEPLREGIGKVASEAILLRDYGRLEALAETLDVQGRFGIRCMDDYDRRIASMERRGDGQMAERLRTAQHFADELGLLPQNAPASKRSAPRTDGGRSTPGTGRSGTSEQAAVRQRQIQQEQQRSGRNERSR